MARLEVAESLNVVLTRFDPAQVAGVEECDLGLAVGTDQDGAQVGEIGVRDVELDAQAADRLERSLASDRQWRR